MVIIILLAAALLIMGIIVLIGKGDNLIAGYNLATEEEKAQLKDEVIICDEQDNFSVLTKEDQDDRMMYFNFLHKLKNPCFLEYEDNDARIFFFNPKAHSELLAKFRAFKATLK